MFAFAPFDGMSGDAYMKHTVTGIGQVTLVPAAQNPANNGSSGNNGTQNNPSAAEPLVPQGVPTSWNSTGMNFRVRWQLSAANDSSSSSASYIDFTFEADTTGWISLAFSTFPAMQLADMYTGWVTSTGQALLFDVYSPDYNQPRQDISQGGTNDIRNVSGYELNGVTSLSFRRNLITGDSKDQVRLYLSISIYVYLCLSSYEIFQEKQAKKNQPTNQPKNKIK